MLTPRLPLKRHGLPSRKNMCLAMAAAAAGALCVFFFALFLIDPVVKSAPSDTITLKAEPIVRSDAFIEQLFANQALIKQAQGDYVEAYVRADSNPYEEDGYVYLSALYKNRPEERLLLKFEKGLFQTAYKGVYSIRGRIHRFVQGPNGHLLAMTVDRIAEADYSAFLTADKVVVMNRTSESGGYKVTLKKAEFTDKETRLYLRIENGTGKPVRFFKAYARLSYYSTFYPPLANPNPDYPALPDTLAPGQTAEGILVMKKVNLKYPWVKLVLDGEIQGIEGEALQNSSFIFRIPLD